jgi:sugar O-acyltransferase (sialic acid O-acetyltransferase NeuD family)
MQSIKEIVIWGATGQAIMLEEILRFNNISILAFFDNNVNIVSPFTNIPIFYDNNKLKDFRGIYFAVAIGGTLGADRTAKGEEMKNFGLFPLTLIHPSAYVSNTSILQEGVQVLPMAKVCSKVKVGEYSIINTGASIDHECVLGKGVHIGPNATLCGCIEVGDYSFIGANSTILPRITIGNNVINGAGAVVTKNVKDNSILVGNPARELIKQI